MTPGVFRPTVVDCPSSRLSAAVGKVAGIVGLKLATPT
jgi:hypothetical protein